MWFKLLHAFECPPYTVSLARMPTRLSWYELRNEEIHKAHLKWVFYITATQYRAAVSREEELGCSQFINVMRGNDIKTCSSSLLRCIQYAWYIHATLQSKHTILKTII